MRVSLIVAITLLVLLAAVFMGVPIATEAVLKREVARSGLGELIIGDVDVNLFQGRLTFTNFLVARNETRYMGGRRMLIDLDLLRLVRGKLTIEAVETEGVEFWLREEVAGQWRLLPDLVVADDSASEPASEAGPISYSLQRLAARDTRLHVEGQALSGVLTAASLSLSRVSNWQLDTETRAKLEGDWNGAPLAVALQSRLVEDQPNFRIELTLNELRLEDFSAMAGLATLAGRLSGGVTIDGSMSRSPLIESDAPLHFNAAPEGGFSVLDFKAASADGTLSLAEAAWRGRVEIDFQESVESLIEGEVVLVDLKVTDRADEVTVELADLALRGTGRLALTADDALGVDFNGALNAGPLGVRHLRQGVRIVAWDALTSEGFQLANSGLVQLANVSFTDLVLLASEADAQGLHTGSLVLEDLFYDPAGELGIATITVKDSDSQLVLDRDGRLRSQSNLLDLVEWFTREYGQPSTAPGRETPLLFAVGKASATKSHVEFVDRTRDPVVRIRLRVDDLTVTGVNSGQPANWIPVSAALGFDEYSSLTLAGEMLLFADSPGYRGTLATRQMPLDDFSAYVEKAVGYEIRTGQLDLTADIDLVDEHVIADLDATFRKLRIRAVDVEDVDTELGMPLGAALNMIRDSDDNITLNNMKIEGNLGEPSISIEQLLVKAMSRTLATGTMTYFKLALQPYGAAFMAAEFLGKELGKVRLDPIAMVPMAAVVEPAQQDYLPRLVKLLENRPKLHLVMCGEASLVADVAPANSIPVTDESSVPEPVNQDPAAQREALLILADARTRTVKQAMIAAGVGSDRLIECKSALNEDPAGARVVLAVD